MASVTAPGVLTVLCLFGLVLVYVLTARTTPGRQFGETEDGAVRQSFGNGGESAAQLQLAQQA